ncbi:hypothetical protein LPN01_18045 [Sphingomonas sp. A2-49]|uniref:hypothetical protein n=1 Tax=Sphingomonas sp. A2-49 TaxID=1391375 RepID=UPI0021CF0010|nr:hypothetical protein [Sphingomonas sp. A2-49]MCU6455983.1 hypothetical protein [Sphingomonas sp. A2-49]
MRRSLVPILSLAIGACVPQTAPPAPPPTPVPVVPVAPPPVPTASSDWRDWPLTPGDWTYRAEPGGSVARFGAAGGDALLTLRCDRATRRIGMTVAGGGAAPLTIRTSSLVRTLPVQPGAAAAGITLAATDGLLDAIGFSRGRFVIERGGAATLVVPAWAEIERVTEDCRG